ncbi:hypothetical protein TGME49_252630 [Toxoplasma gondii ME49]|uniref:Uncharacterized protein n=9 Tax=Toxoplasma gondii TaxID=5811 RepID=S7UN87_TOXGG|nr:hypothetical protein TGME49_252630 [Toxoplasma gondii ME49]EPR59180.1 hypothetical protein TGGT1_252630 [Toxoplasma gondii GT1]KAF4645425.1 hypothetical protein TGRH88_005290 [Toxoplasma gondii]KFH00648.1 hypothetical protein TGMAS_252630 [Toxoplasma gondii MAS]KFH06466.1 hypothetical protein TGVAND_252630 [Toxoplasma gondii VAND]KYF41823.1 hypothetical protein TGARI_252630 [Toxoplasma gondii ARI]PIL96070.1 hypothetical protein TGCOUG_252630 [Toxoplasma gondii COUG]PUA89148.1 hypothetical|eukprot:XP_002369361.1 hypothetical protein TGME49_252630 [Toxoplasma gondii ME49]
MSTHSCGNVAGGAGSSGAAKCNMFRGSARLLCKGLSMMSYRNVSPKTALRVIKAGTFCRTMWPLLPPMMLYQYIRQTDDEMRSVEFLQSQSGSKNVLSFYDTRKANNTGHWRLQQDLAVIDHHVNSTQAADVTKDE